MLDLKLIQFTVYLHKVKAVNYATDQAVQEVGKISPTARSRQFFIQITEILKSTRCWQDTSKKKLWGLL